MLLLDSGAQYEDGTTDVTRTMHFGEPTQFQRECFTRVLQVGGRSMTGCCIQGLKWVLHAQRLMAGWRMGTVGPWSYVVLSVACSSESHIS
jgi:Xaa-Pro aminopeptidase